MSATENAQISPPRETQPPRSNAALLAPAAAIDAVEAATRLPFEEGCQVEQKLFLDCLYFRRNRNRSFTCFSASAKSAKFPTFPKDTPMIPVKSAAVVGAGTMGGGIAMVLANAGIPVLIKETDQAALDRGLATIRSNYEIPSSGATSHRKWPKSD